MKIAYIISAYTDAQNLARLVDALGKQFFFIHVDKNVDQRPFENELAAYENIVFVRDRVAVNWGGGDKLNIRKNCFKKYVGQDHTIGWFV